MGTWLSSAVGVDVNLAGSLALVSYNERVAAHGSLARWVPPPNTGVRELIVQGLIGTH